MAEDLRLDKLPYEIQCNIAAFTAPTSILALSQTCHNLRRASYDPLVFKEALAHQQLGWERGASSELQVTADVKYETAKLARLAVAGQRALDLRYGFNGDFKGECFEGCLRWAPHLVVLKHPFTSSPWLALKLSEVVHGMPLDLPGVFWYTAAMLSTDEAGHAMVCDNMFGNAQGAKTHDHYQLGHLLQVRSKLKAFRAVGVFTVWLRKAIKSSLEWVAGQRTQEGNFLVPDAEIGQPRRRRRFLGAADPDPEDPDPPFGPLQDTDVFPPSAWDIPTLPLSTHYDLPLPFPAQNTRPSRPYWDSWFQHHIERMSKPAFMEDGPWCGYYMNVKDVFFDKPMSNINFVVTPMDDISRHYVRGQGTDHIGDFFLGGILEDTGKMRLRKVYDNNGLRYHNECIMTPFGIYGVWGDGEHFAFNEPLQRPLGAMWIWKSDWRS